MKINKKELLLTSLVCLLPLLTGVALYPRLPETMATHWGFDGTANGWSSRAATVFGLPLFILALHLICFYAESHGTNRNMNPVLRTVLLRRRLKQQRRRFEDPDGRVACQAMLGALHRQLTALQPGAWSEASPRRQEVLTALLGDETARQLTALEQEVWFSDHPIEEPQRQQAQKLLEGTERLWRERVPAARRWKQRFLTCQVI